VSVQSEQGKANEAKPKPFNQQFQLMDSPGGQE
jgi:hypothetical protein